jgi:L-alanine-DL-glutamate epimerase-like enolase superfamily enzyme
MTDADPTITRVRAMTIKHQLRTPIYYGQWVMRHREFALIRLDTSAGVSGFAYCLTRDGPIAAIVERSIAPVYEGESACDPQSVFLRCLWTNHAVHAAGIGMRALSVVDIAAWDAAAKLAGQPMTRFLGGEPRRLPATAIVGYPPDISAEELATQIRGLRAAGWRRFKVPISPDVEQSVERLFAAREAAPDDWLGFDINMVFRSVEQVLEFERRVRELKLGWIEDVLPPGDAGAVAAVRERSETPIAVGDEQGGSYYPEALLAAGAVDVLRVDATTDGGITRLRDVIARADQAGVPVAPHMFPHVHSQVAAALTTVDTPIEWGIPGTGVHPMDDGLTQPLVADGFMDPLPEAPGLGQLVDLEWISEQAHEDPQGLLADL